MQRFVLDKTIRPKSLSPDGRPLEHRVIVSFLRLGTLRTHLHDGGVPICLKCADQRDEKRKSPDMEREIRTILMRDLLQATARANAASDEFRAVMGDVPSALPHPDATQRIHNVSRALSAAREEVMKAHTRLNDFLSRGIVPEDLKQVSGD